MLRKIILARHDRLAAGFKSTLNYLNPNLGTIEVINGYLVNVPIDHEIEQVLTAVDWQQDEVLTFTDLLGGSINQAFTKYLVYPHFHLVTGMNLPLVLSCLMSLPAADQYLDPQKLRQLIKDAQQQIIYVNDLFAANLQGTEEE